MGIEDGEGAVGDGRRGFTGGGQSGPKMHSVGSHIFRNRNTSLHPTVLYGDRCRRNQARSSGGDAHGKAVFDRNHCLQIDEVGVAGDGIPGNPDRCWLI